MERNVIVMQQRTTTETKAELQELVFSVARPPLSLSLVLHQVFLVISLSLHPECCRRGAHQMDLNCCRLSGSPGRCEDLGERVGRRKTQGKDGGASSQNDTLRSGVHAEPLVFSDSGFQEGDEDLRHSVGSLSNGSAGPTQITSAEFPLWLI